MVTYSSNFIETPDLKLHFYRTGGAKPPLVLVHGITDDGLCWLRVAEALVKDFDVIMMDARGHGKSDAPDDGYTMANLSSDLAEFICGLKLDKPILMGHSMGAITVLTMAALYPEISRAIILEDPPAFWSVAESMVNNTKTQQQLLGWINSIKRKTHDELLADLYKYNSNWAEVEFEPWINAKHRFSPKIGVLTAVPDILSLNYPNILQHVVCPVLLIHADTALGSICGQGEIEQLKKFVAHLQTIFVANAGHNIHRDQFDSFLETVEKFIIGL